MKKGDELEFVIESLSTEGKGISRTDGRFVTFIEKTLPGDRVLAQIKKLKSSYAEAKLLVIIKPSEFRIQPECCHFGICGGCKLQNYEYKKQLEFKTQVVRDNFERIGGFSEIKIPDTIGCEKTFFYRNKMEFSFSDDKWLDTPTEDIIPEAGKKFALGLHVPKFHSKIVDVKKCWLQSESSNRILNFTRDFFKQKKVSIYSTKTHEGYLRFLVIRQSANTKDLMVNLITKYFDEKLSNEYRAELLENIPEITTLVNSTTESKAQVAFGQKENVLHGSGSIFEKLTDISRREFVFKISPNSFFQTNTSQTSVLYNVTENFAELKPDDKVLDLYCGTGAISLFVAPKVTNVLGVELVDDAIKNAFENSELNNISNADFVCSDIKDFLESGETNNFNKVILDPPRSGLHPKISEVLSHAKFKKIVYVSCNPSTQARDLKIICSNGSYVVDKIQPVDMFPHTYHVENVTVLNHI